MEFLAEWSRGSPSPAALIACVTLLVGCGGDVSSQDGPDGGGTGGTLCLGYSPQASPEEIEKTPRVNQDAEILAMETAGTLVAPEAMYARVVAELSAVIAQEPTVQPIHPRSAAYSKNPLRLSFEEGAWQLVLSGKYQAWDCPNAAYGAQVTLSAQGGIAELSFGDQRFHAGLLEQEYGALPNVKSSKLDTYSYDGPDVCLEISGAQHFFVFDQASGDCPSGCTDHTYFGFLADSGSSVSKLGVFEPKPGLPEPEWLSSLADCRTRL